MLPIGLYNSIEVNIQFYAFLAPYEVTEGYYVRNFRNLKQTINAEPKVLDDKSENKFAGSFVRHVNDLSESHPISIKELNL